MDRQIVRMSLLGFSFAFFPLTILLLAAAALPAPPLINLKAGAINLHVMTIAVI